MDLIDPLELILDTATAIARERRDIVNEYPQAGLEEKRAVALTVTKLEEAMMWNVRAKFNHEEGI